MYKHICLYIYICTYTYIYIHTCKYIYIYIYIYICMCCLLSLSIGTISIMAPVEGQIFGKIVYIPLLSHTHTLPHMLYLHIHTNMYIDIHIHIHIYIYVYVFVYVSLSLPPSLQAPSQSWCRWRAKNSTNSKTAALLLPGKIKRAHLLKSKWSECNCVGVYLCVRAHLFVLAGVRVRVSVRVSI